MVPFKNLFVGGFHYISLKKYSTCTTELTKKNPNIFSMGFIFNLQGWFIHCKKLWAQIMCIRCTNVGFTYFFFFVWLQVKLVSIVFSVMCNLHEVSKRMCIEQWANMACRYVRISPLNVWNGLSLGGKWACYIFSHNHAMQNGWGLKCGWGNDFLS